MNHLDLRRGGKRSSTRHLGGNWEYPLVCTWEIYGYKFVSIGNNGANGTLILIGDTQLNNLAMISRVIEL